MKIFLIFQRYFSARNLSREINQNTNVHQQHRVEMSKQISASNTLLYIFHNKDHLYPKRRIWSLLKIVKFTALSLMVNKASWRTLFFWKIAGSDHILMHLIKVLPKCQTSVYVRLIFWTFRKNSRSARKKLKAHSGQKTQESGVNLGFLPKNSRKMDFYGSFLEEW